MTISVAIILAVSILIIALVLAFLVDELHAQRKAVINEYCRLIYSPERWAESNPAQPKVMILKAGLPGENTGNDGCQSGYENCPKCSGCKKP